VVAAAAACPGRAARSLRQTAADLDRYLVEYPEVFGKATRSLIAQLLMALNQIAAAVESTAEADDPRDQSS
jgi:hypothetical protein